MLPTLHPFSMKACARRLRKLMTRHVYGTWSDTTLLHTVIMRVSNNYRPSRPPYPTPVPVFVLLLVVAVPGAPAAAPRLSWFSCMCRAGPEGASTTTRLLKSSNSFLMVRMVLPSCCR